ncbi:MAG: PAS domain-containing protein [Proteobacteria bacterium]|nr:PAS domain-containing protein [Pseudomonadota bacterium]
MRSWSTFIRSLLGSEASPTGGTSLSFRELYATSGHAVAILEAGSLRAVEVNPAAATLLGLPREVILGDPFPLRLEAAAREPLEQAAAAALARGTAGALVAATADGHRRLRLELGVVNAPAGAFLIVQLAAAGGHAPPNGAAAGSLEAISRSSDAFVLADLALRIRYSNEAFVRLVDGGTAARLAGQPLDRWLHFDEESRRRIAEQMRSRDAAIALRAAGVRPGTPGSLQVLSIAAPDGPEPVYGFLVRTTD